MSSPATAAQDKPVSSPWPVVQDKLGNRFQLEPIKCPTCGVDPDRVLGERGGEFHRYGQGVATTIAQCGSCGLIFPNPFPYPCDAQSLYGDPSKYFPAFDEADHIAGMRAFVRDCRQRLGRRHFSLLDVGSGRGHLVAAAALEQIDAVGIELSTSMVEYAREKHKVTIFPQLIEDYAKSANRLFDVIVINAVLEHVYDPDSMIRSARALLAEGGMLYIDIPNEPNLLTMIGNPLNKLMGSRAVFNLSPTWPPYHVFGFSPRSLAALLKKHGFEIVNVRIAYHPVIPAGGGWRDRLRAFVGTQINRIANLTGTAANMNVWARKIEQST